jgi:hypothetical protein
MLTHSDAAEGEGGIEFAHTLLQHAVILGTGSTLQTYMHDILYICTLYHLYIFKQGTGAAFASREGLLRLTYACRGDVC